MSDIPIIKRPASLGRRVIEAVRYTIDPMGSWFPPNQPLRPQAPADVKGRAFDYPVAWNLQYVPRSGEPLSFERLTAFAENCDPVRACIEKRKEQMSSQEWLIRPRESQKGQRPAESKYKKTIDTLTNFLEMPDRRHDWPQWLNSVLEQHFVLDAVSIEPVRTRGGDLYSLDVIDGKTIKVLLDYMGRTPEPPSVAFQQVLHGLPASDYTGLTAGDLIYYPKNVRVDRAYGHPPVAQIINYVEMSLRRMRSQIAYFTQGNIPDGFLEAPASMTTDQIESMQRYWDGLFSGNLEQRRHVWWVPNGTKYSEMKEAPLKDEFDEWLIRIVCFAFSIAPTPFIKQMNRATADSSQESAAEEGLQPTMQYIARLMTRIIRYYCGFPDLEFAFVEDLEFDPVKKAAIDKIYAESGIKEIDSVRDGLGLDPVGGAAGTLMVRTPTGYVPIGNYQQEQEQQQQQFTQQLAHQATMARQNASVVQPGQQPNQQPGNNQPGGSSIGNANAHVEKLGFNGIAVTREVLNWHDVAKWATENGLDPLPESHAEIAYSRDAHDVAAVKGDGLAVLVCDEGPARIIAYQGGTALECNAPAGLVASRQIALGDMPHSIILPVSADAPPLLPIEPFGQPLLLGEEIITPLDVFGKAMSAEEIAAAAANAHTSPSRAQIHAGNYRHGHAKIQGLNISIENAKGSTRSGTTLDGDTWTTTMPAHYGYVRGTVGADGEHVDVYVGPDPGASDVWVIDQLDADTGEFDEHKCMVGFDNPTDAIHTYVSGFSDGKGAHRMGSVTRMSMADFKTWLKQPALTSPAAITKTVTTETGLTAHDQGVPKIDRRLARLKARREGIAKSPGIRVGDLVSVESDTGVATNAPWSHYVVEVRDGYTIRLEDEMWYRLDPHNLDHCVVEGDHRKWYFTKAEVGKHGHSPFRHGTITKAKVYRRLPVVPYPLPGTAHQIGALKDRMLTALRATQKKVVPQIAQALKAKLKKDDADDFDWNLAAEIAAGLDIGSLEIIIDSTPELMASAAGDSATIGLGQFGLGQNNQIVNLVHQRAADFAKDRAAEMVGMRYNSDGELVPSANAAMRIDEPTRNMVRSAIYDGLQNGLTAEQIAASVGAVNAKAFSPERAALIANTEIANAHGQGLLMGMKGAKSTGMNVKKEWVAGGADPCEDCLENEDEGPIDVDDDFPSGDDASPAHPRCECSIVGSVAD